MTKLGGSAWDTGFFKGCTSLVSIKLPANISSTGGAFYGCTNLVDVNTEVLKRISFFTFAGCTSLEHITLNKNITTIGDSAFMSCNKLNLSLPESITSIEQRAFRNTALEGNIDLPNLSSIGVGAFRDTKITAILNLGNIKQTPTSSYGWDDSVFYNCKSLLYAIMPASLESSLSTFYGCSSLHSVIYNAKVPPTINQYTFSGCSSLVAIYVPDASVTAYRESSNWSEYADRILPLSEYSE